MRCNEGSPTSFVICDAHVQTNNDSDLPQGTWTPLPPVRDAVRVDTALVHKCWSRLCIEILSGPPRDRQGPHAGATRCSHDNNYEYEYSIHTCNFSHLSLSKHPSCSLLSIIAPLVGDTIHHVSRTRESHALCSILGIQHIPEIQPDPLVLSSVR